MPHITLYAACRAAEGEGRQQHDSGRHRSADREKTELLQELDRLTADLTFQEIRTCVTRPAADFVSMLMNMGSYEQAQQRRCCCHCYWRRFRHIPNNAAQLRELQLQSKFPA